MQTWTSGDKIVITEGRHTGKIGVIVRATLVGERHMYLIDGITKTLRMYESTQFKAAPAKPPVTDPLSLLAGQLFMAPRRTQPEALTSE